MLGKKNKLFADQFLILYLVFAALWHVYIYIEHTGLLQESYWMLMGKGIYLLHAPFLFLYIYALTRQKKLQAKYMVMLFVPFLLYVLHFIYYYLWVFDSVDLSISNGLLYVNGSVAVSWLFFVISFHLIDPIFLVLTYALLRDYKRRLLESVSNTQRIGLNWLKLLFSLWLMMSVVLVPIGVLTVSSGLVSTDFLDMAVQVFSVGFFFTIGFYGFKQTTVFTDLHLKEELSMKTVSNNYERSGLSALQAKEYHSLLLTLMEEKKPFLNGELTASELSQMVGISPNYLSQVLNKEQKQNFFDFVNGYRVKEMILKMEDSRNSHLTLLAMALDSGFNSKTTFNTIFKKATSQTPSQYFKALQK